MKKLPVALCALAACMSGAYAQSNVTIYGIVDGGVAYLPKVAAATAADPHRTHRMALQYSGVMQQSRLGFKGSEDLGDGLRALFVLESGFAIDTGALGNSQVGQSTGTMFGRAALIGLSSPRWGTVQLGRRKDFTDSIQTWYSSVEDFGSFINGPHVANLDRVGGNRANNQIRYDTPDFGGFTGNFTYALGESAQGLRLGESYGFGANYGGGHHDGFGIGFAYWTAKTSPTANSNSDQSLSALCTTAGGTFGGAGTTCLKTFVIGSSYKTQAFRVFGSYSNTKQPNAKAAGLAPNFATTFTQAALTGTFSAGGTNNDKTDVLDVGVDWFVTPALKLVGSVIGSREHFVGATNTGSVKQLNLSADYRFSKRTDAYVFVSQQRTSDMYAPGILAAPGADNSQMGLALGLRHTF